MTDRSEKPALLDRPDILAAVHARMPDPATVTAIGYARGLYIITYASDDGPKRHAVKVCDPRYLVDAIVEFFEGRRND